MGTTPANTEYHKHQQKRTSHYSVNLSEKDNRNQVERYSHDEASKTSMRLKKGKQYNLYKYQKREKTETPRKHIGNSIKLALFFGP